MAVARELTLALLPGLDGTGLLFRPLIDALPAKMRTLTCAYPGDVFLPPPPLADNVEERISGVGDVVILAESWSGLVCLELLRKRLPNIAGVIFVSCFVAPPWPKMLEISRFLPLSILVRLPPPAWLVRRYCFGAGAEPGALRLFHEAVAAVRPDVLGERIMSLRDIGPYGDAIGPPACYIQAAEDRLVPETSVEAFKVMSPTLQVRRIDGPHFLLQARPGACAEIICEFVERLAQRHAITAPNRTR